MAEVRAIKSTVSAMGDEILALRAAVRGPVGMDTAVAGPSILPTPRAGIPQPSSDAAAHPSGGSSTWTSCAPAGIDGGGGGGVRGPGFDDTNTGAAFGPIPVAGTAHSGATAGVADIHCVSALGTGHRPVGSGAEGSGGVDVDLEVGTRPNAGTSTGAVPPPDAVPSSTIACARVRAGIGHEAVTGDAECGRLDFVSPAEGPEGPPAHSFAPPPAVVQLSACGVDETAVTAFPAPGRLPIPTTPHSSCPSDVSSVPRSDALEAHRDTATCARAGGVDLASDPSRSHDAPSGGIVKVVGDTSLVRNAAGPHPPLATTYSDVSPPILTLAAVAGSETVETAETEEAASPHVSRGAFRSPSPAARPRMFPSLLATCVMLSCAGSPAPRLDGHGPLTRVAGGHDLTVTPASALPTPLLSHAGMPDVNTDGVGTDARGERRGAAPLQDPQSGRVQLADLPAPRDVDADRSHDSLSHDVSVVSDGIEPGDAGGATAAVGTPATFRASRGNGICASPGLDGGLLVASQTKHVLQWFVSRPGQPAPEFVRGIALPDGASPRKVVAATRTSLPPPGCVRKCLCASVCGGTRM